MDRRTAKALIFDPGTKRFLLTRFLFSFGNNYGFVGGGVKKSEGFKDGLIREMEEEIGLEPEQIQKITPLEGEAINRLFITYRNRTRMFLVALKQTPDIKLNWESSGYIWLDLENIEKFLSPHDSFLARQLIRNEEIRKIAGV